MLRSGKEVENAQAKGPKGDGNFMNNKVEASNDLESSKETSLGKAKDSTKKV